MRTKVVRITPSIAKEWLEKNVRNRPLSQAAVNQYADSMRAKDWPVTGDAIRFGADGSLLDGQHRLAACVLCNCSFESLVAWDVVPAAFHKLDQGRKRTVGDAFARAGKKNYNALAAAARIIWKLNRGIAGTSNGSRFSIEEGFRILAKYNRAQQIVCDSMSLIGAGCPMTASEVAAYWTFTESLHGAKVAKFWTQILTGQGMTHGCAALLLRESLVNARIGGRDLTRAARHVFIVKAFNGFVSGKCPKSLRFSITESVPEFER